MAIRFAAKVARIEVGNDWPDTIPDNGRRIRPDMLLYAAGRVGATDGLERFLTGWSQPDRAGVFQDCANERVFSNHGCAGSGCLAPLRLIDESVSLAR